MSGIHRKKIRARRNAEEIIGRSGELEKLYSHAQGTSRSGGLFLLSRPGAGATELLARTYDRLFTDCGNVIPIYFTFDRRDGNLLQSSRRFVREFLAQLIAFSRHEPELIYAAPSFEELGKLVPARDSVWLDELVELSASITSSANADPLSAFTLPRRAADLGKRLVVLLDAADESAYLDGSAELVERIKEQWNVAGFQFVLSAHRRFFGRDFAFPRMMLDMPDDNSARQIIAKFAANHGVSINDETRDLAALQLGNDPSAIESIILRAAANESSLESFSDLQRIYADEIFAGGIGVHYDRVIASATNSNDAARKLIAILFDSISAETPLMPLEKWRVQFDLSEGEFKRMIDILNVEELIRVTSNRVAVMHENTAFADCIRGRFRLELKGEDRAVVFATELLKYVNRSPKLMGRHYRAASALGVCELLSRFDGRRIPNALIDYDLFKDRYMGLAVNEISAKLQHDNEKTELPKIIFSAPAES
ncbi:MAG: hypothetical protein ACRD6X_08025, partial [Pyrinomonadaceae bacterium]